MTGPALGTSPQNRKIVLERRLLVAIDALARKLRKNQTSTPPHLATGIRGEEEALFFLRSNGFIIIARRWSTPKLPGDVDLIGWDEGTLCFIEVKTRTGRNIVPAEFAVDGSKQRRLKDLAAVFRKRLPEAQRQSARIRFDIVSVYLPGEGSALSARVEVELFPAAFS